MKAILQNGYGKPEILEYKDIDVPSLNENEVLIRVKAAAIHAGDFYVVQGKPYITRFFTGFPKPKNHIPGFDVAGTVEKIGEKVSLFKPGDHVFGECAGACAEFTRAKENKLILKPNKLSFEQAAAMPTSGVTALTGIRDAGKVKSGQKVLINGAAGGVGTYAIQIAKALGAEVTGVCSTRNIDFIQSIGADYAVDYTKQDFAYSGIYYDLILDNVANRSFPSYRHALNRRGYYLPNSGNSGMGFILRASFLSLWKKKHKPPFFISVNQNTLNDLIDLWKTGKVKPVIDKTYNLNKTSDALTYVGKGHARGKVIITI